MEVSVAVETAKLFGALALVFGSVWGLAYMTNWLNSHGTGYNGAWVSPTYDYGQTWVEVAKDGNIKRLTLNVQYKMMPFGDKYWLMQQVWDVARKQVAEHRLGALVNIQFEDCNYQLETA